MQVPLLIFAEIPSALDSAPVFFLFIILIGLAADALLIASWVFRPKLVKSVPWSLADAFLLYLVAFVASDLLVYAGAQLMNGDTVPEEELYQQMLIVGAVVKTSLVLLIVGTFFRVRGARWKDLFGVTAGPGLKSVGAGVGIFLAALPPVYFVSGLYTKLTEWLPLPVERQEIVDLLTRETSFNYLVLLVLTIIVVAPIVEEIVFRGFLYPALKERFGMAFAAIGISALFAVMHLNLPAMMPLFLLGLGLVAAYELTGSLWAPVATHVAFNTYFTLNALQ